MIIAKLTITADEFVHAKVYEHEKELFFHEKFHSKSHTT